MKKHMLAKSISLALLATTSFAHAASQADANDMEVIVVKGQKIDRSLQETPTSVAVLTSKDLEENNISNMVDVLSMMPNVSGDFNHGFSIRGIDAFSVSGGGNSFLTSVYMDGAPLPFRMAKSGGLSVWDLSQVEVFRGPQSTLQGRNSLAGAIVLRSQDPTYETNGKIKLGAGQDGKREFAFAGGTSIVDDMLAFRVSYEDKSYDGDIYNITRNEGANFEDNKTLRAKVLFEPSDSVDALFTYTRNENKYGTQWSLYDFGDSPFDRTVDYNSPIFEQTETDIYTLELSWDINDELSLHSITTYNDSEYQYNWDGDMQPIQIVKDTKDLRVDKTFSQELRLAYETEEIQAVFGFYTSKVDVDDKAEGERFITLQDAIGVPDFSVAVTGLLMQQGLPANIAAQTAAAVAPLYPNIDPITLEMGYGLTNEIKNSAVYGDVTWSISEKFDLLAGLRYDKEEQTNSSNNAYQVNNTLPDPTQVPAQLAPVVAGVNAYLTGFAAAASGVEPASTDDFSAWLPKLGASYHFDDDTTASFIYQRGYRSGGVGFNVAQSRIYTYDPEYTNNYELSYRSVLAGGSFVFNANAFLLKWKDQQVTQRFSAATFDVETINSAKSEVKGFETEMFYYPSDNLSIKGGLGLSKSKFIDFDHLTGRSFADTPEWTANIASKYVFDNDAYININAKYTGSSYAYLDPNRSLSDTKRAINADPKNDSRIVVNAQLGYSWDKYSVRLDVHNLFDEEYISNYYTQADSSDNIYTNYGQAQVGQSRQISASFQMAF